MPRTLVTTLTTLAGVAFALPAAADRPPLAPAVPPPAVPPQDQTWDAGSSPLMHPGHAVRYWTPVKQAQAKAADLPERLPDPAAAERRSVPAGKRLTPGGDANGYARMPRPYSGAALSRISGRLFFRNAGGQGDSCSASVVRSAARLLVVTAAHCVYSVPEGATGGRWHSSFAFVPAYDCLLYTPKKKKTQRR
ncbi:hypothetical protein [Nonomuraea basaltis]|uniref:hypothetical protein n=1 Tax=Nonomuraea basaltis TaxID=2495887 RepID=UPI00110C6028|nr:hypothetical protein [Nonomuraea basaltis]TMR88116.1 hypothetical protein EJK15_68025 [Nonomuraea basaltis]